MPLTRYEMETIINFNEEEKTASVYTHNGALRRKLEALAQERPENCRQKGPGGRAVEYIVPKGWIRVNPPRIASAAQKAASMRALETARLRRADAPRGGDSSRNSLSESNYTP